MNILIVEDEIIPATYLKKILINAGYGVIGIATTSQKATQFVLEKRPDVILMDIMLKDNISGTQLAKEIYFYDKNIIIIFLTAFSDNEMIEDAVESKAFSYLLKPYRDREILATLELAKSHLRNPKKVTHHDNATNLIELIDGYRYHKELQRLFLNNQEVHLGAKELELIKLLCSHPNISFEIEYIIDFLWDISKNQQTLRSLIHRIREKTSPNLIKNVNKFGYKISTK
jgi:DNA-binding response OmpR family regulator